MKRLLFLPLLLVPVLACGQVVNYAKTLPERSFSLGVASAYHLGESSVGLRSVTGEGDPSALAVSVSGGYGLLYSLDVGARYTYVDGGMDFFGVDLQYLVYEARKSYFSVIGGLHRWDGYGADLTGLFTYSPRFYVNFSVGLDLDVTYYTDTSLPKDSRVRSRVWLPVNVGFNISEMTFLYAELDLQVSELSWTIIAAGANFIFR